MSCVCACVFVGSVIGGMQQVASRPFIHRWLTSSTAARHLGQDTSSREQWASSHSGEAALTYQRKHRRKLLTVLGIKQLESVMSVGVWLETQPDMLTGHRDCVGSWPQNVQTVAARWETLYSEELSSGSAAEFCPRLSNNHSWTGIKRQRVPTLKHYVNNEVFQIERKQICFNDWWWHDNFA